MSLTIFRRSLLTIMLQLGLYYSVVESYATPCPSPSRRYPIGYDPDNRTRPQWEFANLESPETYHDSNLELLPPPIRPNLADPPRPAHGYGRWNPPRGYDPKHRTKLPSRLRRMPKHTDAFYLRDVRPGHAELETIDFDNTDNSDNSMDHRISLCTGIWMGRKILEKRCVCLDYNSDPHDCDRK